MTYIYQNKSGHQFFDPMEAKVAELLDYYNIQYSINQRLDFLLIDYDVYIEVKQFHSDRVYDQLKSQDNIILIQGIKSLKVLEGMLKR